LHVFQQSVNYYGSQQKTNETQYQQLPSVPQTSQLKGAVNFEVGFLNGFYRVLSEYQSARRQFYRLGAAYV
jgi:hypothetical protein